jgi:hypothetical protein
MPKYGYILCRFQLLLDEDFIIVYASKDYLYVAGWLVVIYLIIYVKVLDVVMAGRWLFT